MAKLKSELELTCPCCHSLIVVDTNLGRIISHKEPERGDKPELGEAAAAVDVVGGDAQRAPMRISHSYRLPTTDYRLE